MLQPSSNFFSSENESTLQSRKPHESFGCDNESSMYLIKKTIAMNELNSKEIRIQFEKVTACSDYSNSVDI